jgi:hypothetical protein
LPKKKTHAEFLNQLQEAKGKDYELLSEYVNSRTKLEVKHIPCGTIFKPNPNNLLFKSGCPMCARKSFGQHKTHTPEEFQESFYESFPSDYELLTDYKSSTLKLEVKHIPCGNAYKVLPGILIHKQSGCPFCVSSKGEKLVERLLAKRGICFEKQYSFDDCVYKSKLKFDFAVLNRKGDLLGLIEYDGEQHFKPKGHFGGEEGFRLTKIRDEIKDEYCFMNDIHLLRIPFWKQDRSEEIVDSFIDNILRNAS